MPYIFIAILIDIILYLVAYNHGRNNHIKEYLELSTPDALSTNARVEHNKYIVKQDLLITHDDINSQRHIVRSAYATYGLKSRQYIQSFDLLHKMCMMLMAQEYRHSRGMIRGKTPYDE